MPGCREHIKDNIVPRAVKWFTGEALAEESDEDEVRWWAWERHQMLVLCGSTAGLRLIQSAHVSRSPGVEMSPLLHVMLASGCWPVSCVACAAHQAVKALKPAKRRGTRPVSWLCELGYTHHGRQLFTALLILQDEDDDEEDELDEEALTEDDDDNEEVSATACTGALGRWLEAVTHWHAAAWHREVAGEAVADVPS